MLTISKKEIAKSLGLDRSTVSKILNNYEVDKFNSETVNRVREAARRLGYVKTQRRLHPRRDVGGLAQARVILDDGREFSRGLVYVKNISNSGVLVEFLQVEGGAIPVAPFRLDIDVTESSSLRGVTLPCRPVRLTTSPENRLLGVGLSFLELDDARRGRIRAFTRGELN